jgi:ubiquinone/menaquinone biosynthesis C-methylase UbiE
MTGDEPLNRGYQYAFSSRGASMFDVSARERKACTMVAVLEDYLDRPLQELRVLNVGGSSGIIDHYLSQYAGRVVGIDIDDAAIRYAKKTYTNENLEFQVADALCLPFSNESFDISICSQVYEHVMDAGKMLDEIFRVLIPGGVCYFAANNRLMLNEPHYNLPLLSVLPRSLSHIYIKISGKGDYYYEKHLSYWGLKSLVKKFYVTDYTRKTAFESKKYCTDYMIKPNSLQEKAAKIILKYVYWLSPGYIWLLQKPF